MSCDCENCSNPRLCSECGVELNPNFMEGCWEHFNNPACKFYMKQSPAVMQPQYTPAEPEMVGKWKQEHGEGK